LLFVRIHAYNYSFLKLFLTSYSQTADLPLAFKAVAGERILVRVPMENLFNTPLVLRRSFLLWKFTASGQETTSSNDKQDEATLSSSSAGLVQAEVMDSVTLERGQTVEVTYAITANCKGTLNILGLGTLSYIFFFFRQGVIY
jgi:hypothetical protein